jgi:hypothetical protein
MGTVALVATDWQPKRFPGFPFGTTVINEGFNVPD